MIPTQRDITVSGNLSGERIQMGIDPRAMAKIVGIMTDMYSDPEKAVIREYSTNALDSHIAAGQTRPIEVSLPSALSPFFRIKDYGLGLSVDEVRDVYSKYGASTKDMSNDFNGMLGLGSKSALTYTSQFTVVAVKGGVKATVAVSRGADGVGTMQVVDTAATDEPNGVEIVIPVKYGANFDHKAREFYSFWKPGTVLVNGNEPSLIEGNEVAPGIFSVRTLRQDYIVQGNVAYPVEDGLYDGGYYKDFGVVAYVPNGSVSFAPSREALMYDSTTKTEVARIRKEFFDALTASIQADIDSAPTAYEGLVRWANWERMLRWNMPKGITYKGEKIPDGWAGRFQVFNPGASRYQTQGHRQIGYNVILGDAVIVTDYISDGASQVQRTKMRLWAEDNDLDVERFILVDTAKPFGAPWTDGVETVSWDDVAKTKVNRNPKNPSGPRGKMPLLVWNGSRFAENDNPKPTGNVYYLSPQDKFKNEAYGALTAVEPDAMIVMLGKNRWTKFLRTFPKAKHLSSAVAVISTYKDHLTEDDKTVLGMSYDVRNNLRKLDETKVDDPALVKAIQFAKAQQNTPGIKHYNQMRTLASAFGRHLPEVPTNGDNPLKGYPLILSTYGSLGRIIDHTYLYLNAAYQFAIDNKV